MHHEDEYLLILEKLYIIGVYGSKVENPDFIGCLEKWFEVTPFKNHVLGIERHLYRQKMKDSVLDAADVRALLSEFAQ